MQTLRQKPLLQQLLIVMGIIAIGVVTSTLTRLLVTNLSFLVLFAIVAIVAYYGGLSLTIFAAVVSYFLADLIFRTPGQIFSTIQDFFLFLIYVALLSLIGWVSEQRLRASDALSATTARLDAILNTIADGVTVQDADGKLIFANDAAARLSGFQSVREFLDVPSAQRTASLDLFNEAGQPFPPDELPGRKALRQGISSETTLRYRNQATGDERWSQVKASPIVDASGAPILAVSVFRDVTTTKQASEKLSEDRRRLRSVFENLSDGIITVTAQANVEMLNPIAEQLTGWTSAEARYLPLAKVLRLTADSESPVDLPNALRNTNSITKFGPEHFLLTRNEEQIPIEGEVISLGSEEGAVIVIRDMREHWQLEQVRREGEKRLRDTLDNLIALAVVLTPEGNVLEANATALRNALLRLEDVRGKPFDQTYWWSHTTQAQETLRAAIARAAQGERVRYDALARFSDDHLATVDLMIAPLFDLDDRVTHLVVSALDITDRKLAEQKNLQLAMLVDVQRRRLQDIVNNLPAMVWESAGEPDQPQKIVFINNYCEQILGYSADEWLNSTDMWLKIVHPDDEEMVRQKAIESYRNNQEIGIEFRGITKDGNVVTVETHTTVVKDEQGRSIGARGILMDITQRQQMEDELRRSNAELQQFAYIASHDLQEPLRMVTSYLQLIEQRYQDLLDDSGREFIAFAVDGATRMKNLINDLLMYSRVQRNKDLFETVDLNQVLARALDNLSPKIQEVDAVITADKLPKVMGNETMLVQLFQNLISNGIKFQDRSQPEIRIAVRRDRNEWVFSVQDNGIGIEAEYTDRIFAIFQRLHGQAQYPGTGIGLAVCKKVVENHKGRIWVESEKGRGSTFYFTLPTRLFAGKTAKHESH